LTFVYNIAILRAVRKHTGKERKMSEITADERKRVATTIIRQMGGFGKLKAMVGANSFTILNSGVRFRFKGSRKANCCIVKLDYGQDLYTFELWKIGTARTNFKATKVYSLDGCYFDMLKPEFESFTGLYLSL
jgi:hypothetical protein